MAIKLKKTLYVGLGGTGVATLLKVKKCFIDSYGEIPPMIGFLAIDTDGAANNKSVTSNHGEAIRLDASELLVCTVKNALAVYNTNPKEYDWVPTKNVNALSSIQGGGAGQVRSNGRFIAYFNNAQIKNGIQTAISKIIGLTPYGSKYAVDANKDGVEFPVYINIFASIAGGTGSGMLIDVLSIIREAVNQKSLPFKLFPYIVLPEVFRAMNTGPAMANVLYNSYGALRTIDYIMHHNPQDPAINFGYTSVNEPLFDYAWLINNINEAGVSFNELEDLTDVIAKSSFLPANEMGDNISSPFDNIVAQKNGGAYDILNKRAWAASVGSAELVYDSQSVGRAIAYTTITQLCESMLQSPTDGSKDANNFVDDQNVLIRENNGRDDVINALLSPNPEYSLMIDENTTVQDIQTYIEDNCSPVKLEDRLQQNMNKKLSSAGKEFDNYIDRIMSNPQGKVDAAIKFINALHSIISSCKGEMVEEAAEFHKLNAVPQQWDPMLNAVKKHGIARFFGQTNNDAIEMLQAKIVEVVKNSREETRRIWAKKFYTTFEQIVVAKENKIRQVEAILQQISLANTQKLISEQQNAGSVSKFQLSLHSTDVMRASDYVIGDNVRTAFTEHLSLKGGASQWLNQTKQSIQKDLWDFAKDTSKVKQAVNTNVDDILKQLPQDKVLGYLDHLKTLASPLWTHNTRGYNTQRVQLDTFVVIGVGNRNTSILSTDEAYKTHFDSNGNKASYASTNQYDRVYILIVEALLPIYAINNFAAYQNDSEDKIERGYMMANYLDEKLNNRINAESFNVLPTVEPDDVLKFWTWGFALGFIHFDSNADQYWMRSRNRGNALHQYRYNLGKQRNVAYDIFKSERLYKDIENEINNVIRREGIETVNATISNIKSDGSYYEQYAQLSQLERENIEMPNFKAVHDLMTQEINLMTD